MSSPVADDPAPHLDTPPDLLERLSPSPAIWLVVLVLAGFGALVSLPISGLAGALTGLGCLVVIGGLLIVWTPTVGVMGSQFIAGRAHIPLALTGEVIALDPEQLRREHGRDLDARAFLCIRGWIGTGLRVEITDPDDPTPYWLVSSRRPERLRDAVLAARGAGRTT